MALSAVVLAGRRRSVGVSYCGDFEDTGFIVLDGALNFLAEIFDVSLADIEGFLNDFLLFEDIIGSSLELQAGLNILVS